jgi:hypothetical protein
MLIVKRQRELMDHAVTMACVRFSFGEPRLFCIDNIFCRNSLLRVRARVMVFKVRKVTSLKRFNSYEILSQNVVSSIPRLSRIRTHNARW